MLVPIFQDEECLPTSQWDGNTLEVPIEKSARLSRPNHPVIVRPCVFPYEIFDDIVSYSLENAFNTAITSPCPNELKNAKLFKSSVKRSRPPAAFDLLVPFPNYKAYLHLTLALKGTSRATRKWASKAMTCHQEQARKVVTASTEAIQSLHGSNQRWILMTEPYEEVEERRLCAGLFASFLDEVLDRLEGIEQKSFERNLTCEINLARLFMGWK